MRRYGALEAARRRQLTTWAVTAESFACHDCPRRHVAPSSSGHGRSPGDHPSWLGLRPGRQLRQRATEGRPGQRRRATRTPPRHGTAATCALASLRSSQLLSCRGAARREALPVLLVPAGRPVLGRQVTKPRYSPFVHFHSALASLAFRQPVRVTSAPPGRGRYDVVRPGPRRRRSSCGKSRMTRVVDRSRDSSGAHCLGLADGAEAASA
jgi:hypothetical protein